jgi:hypothetical protein
MVKRIGCEEHKIIKKMQKLTINVTNKDKKRDRDKDDEKIVEKIQKLMINYINVDNYEKDQENELYNAYIFDIH